MVATRSNLNRIAARIRKRMARSDNVWNASFSSVYVRTRVILVHSNAYLLSDVEYVSVHSPEGISPDESVFDATPRRFQMRVREVAKEQTTTGDEQLEGVSSLSRTGAL